MAWRLVQDGWLSLACRQRCSSGGDAAAAAAETNDDGDDE